MAPKKAPGRPRAKKAAAPVEDTVTPAAPASGLDDIKQMLAFVSDRRDAVTPAAARQKAPKIAPVASSSSSTGLDEQCIRAVADAAAAASSRQQLPAPHVGQGRGNKSTL